MKLTKFRYQPAFYCPSYFQIYNQNIDLMVAMERHNKAKKKKERKKRFTTSKSGYHKQKHNSSEDAHNTRILTKSTSKAKKTFVLLVIYAGEHAAGKHKNKHKDLPPSCFIVSRRHGNKAVFHSVHKDKIRDKIQLYLTTLATHNKSWFPGGA